VEKLTAGRRWAALLALALGGFGLGLTEFVAMGLLPDMARDLLPAEYAHSSADAVAKAGWMITSYALGVVVGAPTIAALTARMPRRRLVVGLLGLFVIGTVASALAPTFGLVLAGRFVAGLAHGAYFGAAGLLAAAMLGPGSAGRGFAIVLGGLTAANIFGVPLITGLGQAAGWRIAYLAVAAVFAITLLAVLAVVPEVAAAPGGSPRDELAAFRLPQVWLAALVAAIGFGGFFAVNSYIAPITTHVTGLSASAVPWVLAVMGVGMTVGSTNCSSIARSSASSRPGNTSKDTITRTTQRARRSTSCTPSDDRYASVSAWMTSERAAISPPMGRCDGANHEESAGLSRTW